MKVLITGGDTPVGTELQVLLYNGRCDLGRIPQIYEDADIFVVNPQDLNLSSEDEVKQYIRKVRPDVVFHCDGYDDLSGCEKNPSFAMEANALWPKNIATALSIFGGTLVHLSSSFVFDGKENGMIPKTEEDYPNPVTTCGMTKLSGESYIQSILDRHYIVRTGWLYSRYGDSFARHIFEAAKTRASLQLPADQYGSPTYGEDLAYVLLWLYVTDQYGLYHCTGEGFCSLYEFAQEMCAVSGLETELIPIETSSFTKLPLWSVLDNYHLRMILGTPMRSWQDALLSFFSRDR